MASEKTLHFGTAFAAPGCKAFGALHVGEGGRRTTLPLCVLHGARPGRHIVALAGQHGTEVNGIESLRRFCAGADARRMRGTLFAVLSANPRAAAAGLPVWTEGDPGAEAAYNGPYNMNFVWPGRQGGKGVERAAHEVWTQAILAPHRRADFVLDLHSHQNATAVYAEDDLLADFGVAAGFRNIVITGRSDTVQTLGLACFRAGIPCMTAELSGQGTFRPESVEEGVRAVENLLKFFGLLPGAPRLPGEAVILDPWRDHRHPERCFKSPSFKDCVAGSDGLVVQLKRTYDLVRKGELLGHVVDPFRGAVVEECRAPMAGAIYNWRTGGVVAVKGKPLLTLAVVRKAVPARRVGQLKPGEMTYGR
jgi:predicted deacylase